MAARVRGLDVSEANGTIAWSTVPAEFRYVFVKCEEGAFYADPTRLRNLEGVAASGRIPLVYIFFRSSQDPEAQAEALYKAVGPDQPLLVLLDFETIADGLTPEQACAKALALAKAIEARFGYWPAIYLYPDFARRMAKGLAACPELGQCPLMMADYSGGENPPDGWHPFIPSPWTKWAFAQTSGNNSSIVPGIPSHVDHDLFNGDEDALRALLGLTGQGEAPAATVHPDVDMPAPDYSNGNG